MYRTKQRGEIMRFLSEHPDECFSAKELIGQVGAGEATVFRTLSALAKEGLIQKFTGEGTKNGCAYYKYKASEECGRHLHLKCLSCGRLLHADCDFMKEMTEHFESEHSFRLDSGRTVIYGLCKECSCRKDEESCND